MLKIQLNLHIKETKKNGRKLEQKLIRLRSNNCLIKSLVTQTNQFRLVKKRQVFIFRTESWTADEKAINILSMYLTIEKSQLLNLHLK